MIITIQMEHDWFFLAEIIFLELGTYIKYTNSEPELYRYTRKVLLMVMNFQFFDRRHRVPSLS